MRWRNFLAADERWKAILKSRGGKENREEVFFLCTLIQPFYAVRLRWWCGGASWKVKINRRKKIRDDDEDKNFLFHHPTQSIDVTFTVRIESRPEIWSRSKHRLDSNVLSNLSRLKFHLSDQDVSGRAIESSTCYDIENESEKQIKSRIM